MKLALPPLPSAAAPPSVPPLCRPFVAPPSYSRTPRCTPSCSSTLDKICFWSSRLLYLFTIPPTQRAYARCTTRPTRAEGHGSSSSPPPRVRHLAPPQVRPATLQPDRDTRATVLAGRRAYGVKFNLGLRFSGRQVSSEVPPPQTPQTHLRTRHPCPAGREGLQPLCRVGRATSLTDPHPLPLPTDPHPLPLPTDY